MLSEQIIKFLKAEAPTSFTAEQIGRAVGMESADDFTVLIQTLAQMERDKQVAFTTDNQFKAVVEPATVVGKFRANPKGFGFVAVEGSDNDIYVNADHTMHALNGDQVEVKILRPGDGKEQGPEGQVVNIVERSLTQVVGEFKRLTIGNFIGEIILKDKKLANYKFYVSDEGIKPVDNEVVLATIKEYPTDEAPEVMTGPAMEVIGNKDEPGIDILSVIYAHDVPHEFSPETLAEADAIPEVVRPEDKAGRPDLTDQPLVTIDSIESKDLDDAVVAWKLDNGNYHLGVHIADVSHYVRPGTALDQDAFERGTSVYLTDRVVPMLPKKLSNGICSLNPGEERLAMSCEMEITPAGQIVKHKIFPSVIRSHARMTYKAVNRILEDHDQMTRQEYRELVPMFETMGELHEILLKARHDRGAIDFEAPEAKIIVDVLGHPTDIEVRERGLSERMIESFMLAANETVAKHYDLLHVPFLYRIHEQPDTDRIKNFAEFLSVFGIQMPGDLNNVKPKMLQEVLRKVAGTPEEQMVQVMMLRSMQQAKYNDEELGHFGLGAQYYTHFTSPIRRYPDTTVHRLIKWYHENGTNEAAKAHWRERLSEIAEHTSVTERRGIDTERDVDSLKKAEFMEDHVGETFDAVVSSVMKFGLFVALPNTVEGLVHISVMKDDFYEYIEKHMALVGRSHHHIFRIGQPVKVKLLRVDKELREVDFELVNPREAPLTKLRVPRSDDRRGGRRNGGNRRGGNQRNQGGYQGKRRNNRNNDWGRENGERNNAQINRGQSRHRPHDEDRRRRGNRH